MLRIVTAVHFAMAIVQEYIVKMIVDTEETVAIDRATSKLPDKFKQQAKWFVFAEAIAMYLSQQKGGGQIPLNYVIHDADPLEVDAVYKIEHEQIINTVPLLDVYEKDNDMVHGIVKTLVLKGPGWHWISHLDQSCDGQAAWLALRAHYEGDSFQNHQKEAAFASIASSQYQGEHHNFSFKTYIT